MASGRCVHRIVERNRLIVVRSGISNVPCMQQGSGQETMRNHERACRLLLLGERQELRGKLAQCMALERYKVSSPEAIEDRKQQQWVFGRFSEYFRFLNQHACLLRSRLGFRRGIPFDVDEWGYERDL